MKKLKKKDWRLIRSWPQQFPWLPTNTQILWSQGPYWITGTSRFVRPTLCITSTVQDYIVHHWSALCTTDLHCARVFFVQMCTPPLRIRTSSYRLYVRTNRQTDTIIHYSFFCCQWKLITLTTEKILIHSPTLKANLSFTLHLVANTSSHVQKIMKHWTLPYNASHTNLKRCPTWNWDFFSHSSLLPCGFGDI